MKRFRRSNPQLGSALQALALPNSPIKLLAVGPASGSGFLTNLNVLVTRIPSQISFDEWKRTEAAEIKTVGAVRDLTEEETQLPPGRALHLTYHASFRHPGGSYTAFVHQYFVRNEGFLYVLTYTTLPSSEPRYRRTFADSAHTFQLIG